MTQAPGLCLIGTGQVFDSIRNDPAGHGLPEGWTLRPAGDVRSLSASVATLLEGLDPVLTRLFVAVDHNALNLARLELYGAARLRGLKLATLVHARAVVAPDAVLADNVWIAPGALVGTGVRVASDVLVNAGARLDTAVRIGMHGWIGPGAAIGAGAEIGAHCVVGADVLVRAGAKVGKFCVIDRPGPHADDLPAGTFIAAQFVSPARMIGAGYSFEKQR